MLKKPKKVSSIKKRAILKKKLDIWFSRWIRLRDADTQGYINCISCNVRLYRKDAHCCHFVSRADYNHRRDPTNCRAGCAGCNTYRKEFHMRIFTVYMVKTFGIRIVERMGNDKWTLNKLSIDTLEAMLKLYKGEVEANKLYK